MTVKASYRSVGVGIAALCVIEIGCASGTPVNPSDGRVASGLWGGEHVSLAVSSAGAQIEFDCASGQIATPLTIDSQGRLSVEGVYMPGHPGPIMVGEDPPRRPARYSGRVDGHTMTFDVLLTDSNQTIGPFTLALGQTPRVLKCL